jgi:hypothetical protein
MHTPTRTALIGPFTHGGISAINDVCNTAPGMNSLPPLDVSSIILSTMFQAGVDLFEVHRFDGTIRSDSSFWLKRIQVYPEDEYNAISEHVSNLFKSCLPPDYCRNDEYSPVWAWESFLTDLLYCLKRNTVMACGEIPDIAEVKDLLPPEICVPISNLCEQIITEPLAVPIPKASIPQSQIKRFRAIVESDSFETYVDAHAGLDSSRCSVGDAVARIVDSSHALQYNYPALLKLRDIAMGVLPATGKLVSTVFQQIPGEIAETLTTRISSWLSADRQVVIYETKPIMLELFLGRFRKAREKEKDEVT